MLKNHFEICIDFINNLFVNCFAYTQTVLGIKVHNSFRIQVRIVISFGNH